MSTSEERQTGRLRLVAKNWVQEISSTPSWSSDMKRLQASSGCKWTATMAVTKDVLVMVPAVSHNLRNCSRDSCSSNNGRTHASPICRILSWRVAAAARRKDTKVVVSTYTLHSDDNHLWRNACAALGREFGLYVRSCFRKSCASLESARKAAFCHTVACCTIFLASKGASGKGTLPVRRMNAKMPADHTSTLSVYLWVYISRAT
mmetsp:Transcript_36842/g.98106  ORF Transcript_36842/g.98106 Transcript_36842/m.98106 type:complete len:205 (+) Transcript_36842:536-1150(+)